MQGVQAELFSPPASIVGTRLRVARWLGGYTQSELARLTGLSATAVSEVECGGRRVAPKTFADVLPTMTAFLSRPLPDFEMASSHDCKAGTKASDLVGVVIADFHAYASSFLDLIPSPLLVAPDPQSPSHWAAAVRDQLELGRRRPIANVLAVGERLGVFIVSTGSQAGPLFVAGLADGAPVAAIPAGPDGVSRRWATACAIGALAVTPSGKGIKGAMRLGAELLIPVEGLIATHRPDWSADQNAARWGAPATVYGAVAGRHGLTMSEASPEVQEDLGWEQSAALMTLLARLRSDGLRLEDVSRELGYPTSVLRALFRGLALTSV